MNRHVNRLVLIGAVASLALASCNKNKETEGGIAPENGFRATVEANQGNGSRTHLVGTEVQWNAGDQIKVRNANGIVCTYQLTEGENTSNGIFYSGEDNNIDFFQPTYTAIYPATGNSITGEGAAQFTLPATQSYAENSFGNGAMPMMAVSGDQTLAFKNVLGGICIPLTGDGLTVTKVVLTSKTNEPLNGVFNANYSNGQPTLRHTSGGTNSITLECNPAVTIDATTATDFIFMVPAGALASGFSVTAYDGETAYVELSTTANPIITRSMISKVSTSLEVEEPVVVPEGAISGLYRINGAGDMVYFSQGNLQYIGSAATPYWKFADHQWDYLGTTTGQGSDNQNVDRDLFGWGTSGWSSGANAYLPYSTSTSYSDYYPGGAYTNSLTGDYANADWGVYNDIMAGGTTINAGTYRTLTNAEWSYVINNHTKGWSTVNGVRGFVLRPYGVAEAIASSYDAAAWAVEEAAGSVFLPAAGYRVGTSVLNAGSNGDYWSSTYFRSDGVYYMYFLSGDVGTWYYYRYYGRSVRLVCPAE